MITKFRAMLIILYSGVVCSRPERPGRVSSAVTRRTCSTSRRAATSVNSASSTASLFFACLECATSVAIIRHHSFAVTSLYGIWQKPPWTRGTSTIECGSIRSRVGKVFALSFPKQLTLHSVSLSGREREGLIPSVGNWFRGMAHAVPSTCALIFVTCRRTALGLSSMRACLGGLRPAPQNRPGP